MRAEQARIQPARRSFQTPAPGAVHGGSHKDETPDPDAIGIYGRKTEADPQELSDTSRARGYGVRCVGNRESAGEDGTLPEFDDMFTLGRL